DSTLAAAENLVTAVDRDQVAATMNNIEQFTRRLDEASGGLEEIMAGVRESVASISEFTENANRTLARVDGIVEAVDAGTVRTALTNFEQASVGVNAAVN